MNEIAPFSTALAFINKQVSNTSLFSIEDLPVSHLELLLFTKEEEVLYYLISLPCLNKLVISKCGHIWEPWTEPLSTYLAKYSKYEILREYDDRRKEVRQKNLFNWIVYLCNWNKSKMHNIFSH